MARKITIRLGGLWDIPDANVIATWQQLQVKAAQYVQIAIDNSVGGVVVEPLSFHVTRDPATMKLTKIEFAYEVSGQDEDRLLILSDSWHAIAFAEGFERQDLQTHFYDG